MSWCQHCVFFLLYLRALSLCSNWASACVKNGRYVYAWILFWYFVISSSRQYDEEIINTIVDGLCSICQSHLSPLLEHSFINMVVLSLFSTILFTPQVVYMTSDTNQDVRTFLAVKFSQLIFSELFHFILFPVIAIENSVLTQQFNQDYSFHRTNILLSWFVMQPKTNAFEVILVKISWYIFEFLSEN